MPAKQFGRSLLRGRVRARTLKPGNDHGPASERLRRRRKNDGGNTIAGMAHAS